jgi:hypothetical protein
MDQRRGDALADSQSQTVIRFRPFRFERYSACGDFLFHVHR